MFMMCPNCNNNPKCSGIIKDRRAKSCKSCSKYRQNHPQFKNDIPFDTLNRRCPVCNKEITCTSRVNMRKAINNGWWCRECSKKKIQKSTSRAMKEWKDNPFKKVKIQRTITANRLGFSSYTAYKRSLSKWKRYRTDVWRITKSQPLYSLKHFDRRGRCGKSGAYQIDHIISVYSGFKQRIPASTVGNITNLRMIPWLENAKKGVK